MWHLMEDIRLENGNPAESCARGNQIDKTSSIEGSDYLSLMFFVFALMFSPSFSFRGY